MNILHHSSMTKHPTQPHIVVGGGSNGVLAFWDLRGSQVIKSNYFLNLILNIK